MKTETENGLLRAIPGVDLILRHPLVAEAARHAPAALCAAAAREVLGGLRQEILSGGRENSPLNSNEKLAAEIAARIKKRAAPSLRRIINATGVILHTNLGRAPLADSAVRAVADIAGGYSTLEYDLETAERGSRHKHSEGLIRTLTGAEDAVVVNNNAAAVLLMLAAVAKGREVIVSRGELVEIGGAFRVPEVMEQSGCVLREVGATNRTRPSDFERAIDPARTGALLKVHTSNYRVLGFTGEVALGELARLGQKHGLPVLCDLGSGAMLELSHHGFLDEPDVPGCIKAGADIVCFSGDKLLGGPQAGIAAGKAEIVSLMKNHPLYRALRVDKLTLAALEATLRLYLEPEKAAREIPVCAMLFPTAKQQKEKAHRLAARLTGLRAEIAVVDADGQTGGGSMPVRQLPGAAVELSPMGISVAALEEGLRGGDPPIIAIVRKNRLLLDTRTVAEEDFPQIAKRLRDILNTA